VVVYINGHVGIVKYLHPFSQPLQITGIQGYYKLVFIRFFVIYPYKLPARQKTVYRRYVFFKVNNWFLFNVFSANASARLEPKASPSAETCGKIAILLALVIKGIVDDKNVLVADGDLRRIEKPKRKKIKHLRVTKKLYYL